MDENKGKEDSLPVSRTSKAPRPTSEVGGRSSWIPRSPELTRIPDLPSYYPNELKVQTKVILDKAARKFPDRTHALAFCKFVIRGLTLVFRTAVEDGDLRSDLALSNMDDLVDGLARVNSNGGDGYFRLQRDVQFSDERMKFNRQIAAAQRHVRAQGTCMLGADKAGAGPANRKSLIMTLLNSRSMSLNDWATQAGVDYNTIVGYIKNERKSYPSTRKNSLTP
jgi:hypothetical protein